ncbi:hypothetical protein DWF74_26595 [Pseudomonas protegens]|nr:hypothetical protein DWF74_26595 [Pseudomonas protegens]
MRASSCDAAPCNAICRWPLVRWPAPRERIAIQRLSPSFCGLVQELTMAAKTPTGPRSSEHASNHHDPGFDPDSPDLADPQVDPVGPARAPLDQPEPEHQRKRSRAYDPLANLRK